MIPNSDEIFLDYKFNNIFCQNWYLREAFPMILTCVIKNTLLNNLQESFVIVYKVINY